MKLLAVVLLISSSFSSFAQLKVKVDMSYVRDEKEASGEYYVQYNQDLVLKDEHQDRKYILRISPVKSLKVNGKDLSPLQFDLKVYDNRSTLLNKPQTVTSFYRQEATFNIPAKNDIKTIETGIKVTILQ